ncbi:uncharacterized protein LOC120343293 isoform X2 [Styela clava]
MSSINPKRMKVAELKKELESRSISVTKNMKKADLVALLLSAVESETGQEREFSSSEAPDDSAQSEVEGGDSILEDEPAEEPPPEVSEPNQEEAGGEEFESFCTANDETEQVQEPTEDVAEPTPVEQQEPQEEEKKEIEQQIEEPPQPEEAETESKQEMETAEPVAEPATEEQEEQKPAEEVSDDAAATDQTADVKQEEEQAPKIEQEEFSTPRDVQDVEMSENVEDAEKKSESAETKTEESGETGEKTDEKQAEENGDEKQESKESKDDYHDHARKRRHDDRYDRHSRWEDRFAPPEEEPEEEFDDNLVVLDLYNSDLNFKVNRDRTGGQPLTMEGFAYLWGGARATYGVKSGKICYECKILEEEAVKHLPSDEPHPRVVRVGWSAEKSGIQLGEEPLSFGYGGTGKSSVDCNFNDFGETFHEGDVIGCYVNFEQEDKVEISYTKNGNYLGVAFTEEKAKLEDPLFPHVLCKNTSVEMNFGQKEAPFFSHPEELTDYTMIGSLPLEDRVRAQKAPEAKKDCEVLMMCGLPGAGKTYYAVQKLKENPDKKYNVLGTNAIMEKMKVMGVARKRNYAGRWEILIQNATHCLNRLLQLACRKRRNYILDQTNVYPSAQRRKMRPFEGFQRKAIVIVPSDEEYKQRFEKRTQDEGKEVPDMAVLEMKANFSLPEKGNLFDEVIFTELEREEAEKLVEKYREDGRKNGPPPEKRSRNGDNRSRGPGGWRQRDNYGPPMPYGNRGGWGRYGGGGGGPMGYGRGGGGGGFGGGFRGRGGGYGGRGGYGNRGYDQGRDYNRGGGRRDNRGGSGGGSRDGAKRGGWQQSRGGYGGGRGGGSGDMYGGYNKHNQGRGGSSSSSSSSSTGSGGGGYRNGGGSGGYQGRQGSGGQNKYQGNNASSNTHPSAQSYTYGHHPNQQQQQPQQRQQQQMQNYANYGMQGYNYQQPSTQSQTSNAQTQQQGYQQQYGQQDYSQQWAQYYQAQQNQQYQNYYANYQQYYNQQAAAAQQQQQQVPKS